MNTTMKNLHFNKLELKIFSFSLDHLKSLNLSKDRNKILHSTIFSENMYNILFPFLKLLDENLCVAKRSNEPLKLQNQQFVPFSGLHFFL